MKSSYMCGNSNLAECALKLNFGIQKVEQRRFSVTKSFETQTRLLFFIASPFDKRRDETRYQFSKRQ
jgi:hypothetical protein